MSENKTTYITTFSGAGGAGQGFKDFGARGLFALDNEPNSVLNLKANFPEMDATGCILDEDIKKVSGERIMELTGFKPRELTFYQSSPPCQGVSRSNNTARMTDPRNFLVFESIKHIKALQPEVFFIENVENLKGPKNSSLLHAIKSSLIDAGYKVGIWVLDASRYGIPQKRKRLWIIGVRDDIGIKPSVPDYTDEHVGVSDVCPHIQGHFQGQFDMNYLPGNQPLSTLTKTGGIKMVVGGKAVEPEVADLKALCTFPKSFQLVGKKSEQCQRLGNAVLPRQMEILANHLYETVIKVYHADDEESEEDLIEDFFNEPEDIQETITEPIVGSEELDLSDEEYDDFERSLLAEIASVDEDDEVDMTSKKYKEFQQQVQQDLAELGLL